MRFFKILFIIVFSSTTSLDAQEIVLKGKELFGDMKARQIGPAIMSGRINDIEGHPTNNRIIYIGAAGGGVWKSANGGASFQPIFDEFAQSIGVVKLDPADPDNIIWVGTGETWTRNSVSVGDGLYRSVDGGVSWEKFGFDNAERIAGIEINPDNSLEMYVAVLGALWSDSDDRGLYKTIDGGKTWKKILYTNSGTGCTDIIMDPKDPETLYAAMWEFRRTAWSFSSGGNNSALYKSTDGGETWQKIHNGFPQGELGRFALALAPSNSQVLYAAVEAEDNNDKGLYRSDNGGETWEHMNKDFGLVVRPFYFSRMVVDPRDENTVVKAGLTGSVSRDGGKTFKDLGYMHGDIHDILFDIRDSDRMYVATDGGLYRTWDGCVTMEIVANLPLSQFYHVSVDNEEPYNVYGGLQDNDSWYGPSSSPGGVQARDWNSVGAGDGFRVYRHSTKPIIYSEMQGAENVWRYDIEKNQAKTIQPLPVKGDPKLRFNWNAPMALSTHQPDRFYMGSQFLHKSEDMGDNWVKISPDLTTNDPAKQNQAESGGLSLDNSGAENHCTIFTIAESSIDEKIIWVGTDDGNVQVTRDGGETWTNTIANVPELPANTWCYHIEASVHHAGTAYAVFDGHTSGDMNPYVYKTDDFGQNWKAVMTDDIIGFARNIQEDYVNENLLFLGTEFGLFITIDGGKNWSRFTNNMPAVAVHYIEMHRGTNDLVMGTHGRGVIIIDDISPLRELNQELLAKDVHFFENKPAIIMEESGFGGGSTEMEFVGPNRTTSARIIYYLKKKHIFGRMTMEVQDMEGHKIAELSPGKAKGINVVTWNFRTKRPKTATGKTLARGGFTAPRVLPGQYKVVMTKGKETYETILSVNADPSSLLSEAERLELHEITMKLFDMNEELAYLVYEIDEYIDLATKLSSESSSAKKVAEPVSLELTALKESLVITTGDNYVGMAEPQLREKISSLYSKIAGGFTKPSNSEMENLALLEEQFNDARDSFEIIKSKRIAKMNKYLEKNDKEIISLKSFEEFRMD